MTIYAVPAKRSFTLGCVIPGPTDGTSFYRGVGPVRALDRITGPELSIQFMGPVNWATLMGVSALFLQRPYTGDHLKTIAMARAQSIPIWVDYDDDLYAVPLSNPTSHVYGGKPIRDAITSILAQADVVTVTTPNLKNKFDRILESLARSGAIKNPDPDKVVVVPNGYDSHIFRYSYSKWQSEEGYGKELIALWRGSNTHDEDLFKYTPALSKAFKAAGEKWTLNFVGSPFWKSIDDLEKSGISPSKIVISGVLDVLEYFQFIHTISPALWYVPLVDNDFNRSKSNISWIEACHAGAICIAPDLEEWRRPGVLNYGNEDDFERLMRRALSGEIDLKASVKESRDYIEKNLLVDNVNRTRIKIIESLERKIWAEK